MNKFFLFFLILIYSCSLNSKSSFWTKTKKTELDKSFTKTLFQDIEPNENEFNPKLKIKINLFFLNLCHVDSTIKNLTFLIIKRYFLKKSFKTYF